MPYREMKLREVRKLVDSGKVEAAQIEGLEDWPEDALITIPLKAEVLADITAATPKPIKPGRKISQEEASAAADPTEPASPAS